MVNAVVRVKLFHLQALRGLAASLVVLAHSVRALHSDYSDRFLASGYFGVATFFIISGFIIYKTSRSAFGSLRGVTEFITKRLVRVFPIYWIATILGFVLSPHRAAYSASDVVCSLLLIPHYIKLTNGMDPLLGQGWSLHYELLFYLLFAAGMVFKRRYGVLLTIIALAGLAFCGLFIRPESDATGPLTLPQYYCRPIILLFPIGIGLGLLEERWHRFALPAPFWAMMAILTCWFWYSLFGPSLNDPGHVTVSFFLIMFVSIFGRSAEGWFESVAQAFGDASYSVYLFHTFILSVFVRLKFLGAHPVLFVGGALIGANLFGYLVYICVEKPILARLRRALLATSTPVADGGPSRYRGERQGSLPSDGYGGTRTGSAQ
jgi:exopolysaccharide production protein ExoZ